MQPVWGQQVIQLALPFLPFMIILYLSIPPFHCTPPFLSSLFSFVPFLFFLTLCSQPLGPKLVFFSFLSCVAGLALIGSSLPFYPSSKISPENTSNVVLIWSVWQTKKNDIMNANHLLVSATEFAARLLFYLIATWTPFALWAGWWTTQPIWRHFGHFIGKMVHRLSVNIFFFK